MTYAQLDTGQVFSFKSAQCSLFWGMSTGVNILLKIENYSGTDKNIPKFYIIQNIDFQSGLAELGGGVQAARPKIIGPVNSFQKKRITKIG